VAPGGYDGAPAETGWAPGRAGQIQQVQQTQQDWRDWRDWGPSPELHPDHPSAPVPRVQLPADHPSAPMSAVRAPSAPDLPGRSNWNPPARQPEADQGSRRLRAVPDDFQPSPGPARPADDRITREAQDHAAAIRAAAEREAAAIREAAQREAAELRARLDSMSAELGAMVEAYTTGGLAAPARSPAAPALPAARPARPAPKPAARPPARPRPVTSPDRPATSPATPAARPGAPRTTPAKAPQKQPRQRQAMRVATYATAAMLSFAVITGAAEIGLHGFSFFAFRGGGVGQTPGTETDQQFLAHQAAAAHHVAAPRGRHAKKSHETVVVHKAS
jgi:hypothetical protein